MYMSLFVSELPIIVNLMNDQKIFVRVDGPISSEELTDQQTMDQRIKDFWATADRYLKSKQQPALQDASAGASETPDGG